MKKLLLALCITTAAAACSSGSETGPSAVADKLAEVRSGHILMRVVASTELGDGGTAGFEVSGPFEFGDETELPEADWSVTRLLGDDEALSRFVSTGERAFVEVEGQLVELNDEQVQGISGTSLTGLDGLNVDEWILDPETVEEDDRTVIEGELDLPAVVDDLLALAQAGAEPLTDEENEQLREAVASSHLRILADGDGFLTQLDAEVKLAGTVPDRLTEAGMGDLVGAKVILHMELDRVNEEVDVEVPAGASP